MDLSQAKEMVVDVLHNLDSWVSYADISRKIDPGTDAHSRNRVYNLTVRAVKKLHLEGVVAFRKRSLAGHPAQIMLTGKVPVRHQEQKRFW